MPPRRRAIRLPPALSISYRLIETWFDAGSARPLARMLDPERRG